MSLFPPVLFLLLSLTTVCASPIPQGSGATEACRDTEADPAQLREVLQDPQKPREQSQAALLLVRHRSAAAEEIVRRGLRQTSSPEVFLVLASALRLAHDTRFTEELLVALTVSPSAQRTTVQQAAAETLAVLADTRIVQRLQKLLEDGKSDLGVRQAVLWVLGRSGRKQAAGLLVETMSSEHEAMQRAAADALTELTGLTFGVDRARWRDWWAHNKDISSERWLEQRLAYQDSRARRLEGELQRTRSHMVQLHQQLYSRLPVADRLGHIQSAAELEDPAVRQLAVNWSVEILASPAPSDASAGRAPGAAEERMRRAEEDGLTQRTLAEVLLRLSHDSHPEVQRQAVLGLGRVSDDSAFDRLRSLIRQGRAPVRAAASRALAQQARGNDDESLARRKQVVPILQKALDDPALEVVVEVAEDLGALGVPEAAPVLVCLLQHASDHVRQTAVLALERVADASVLEELLGALDDPAVAVRFSLVGAVSRAVEAETRRNRGLSPEQREKVLSRLQAVLQKDADPGVRSRAATVLGEWGPPSVLPALWQRVQAGEDSRVQEKAWSALVEVIARAGSLDVLRTWDKLARARSGAREVGARRLRLLADIHDRWQKRPDAQTLFVPTAELLASAQLDHGKWAQAAPLLNEILTRAATDKAREPALRLLLLASEQALREGNAAAARRFAEEARPYLPRDGKLTEKFKHMTREE